MQTGRGRGGCNSHARREPHWVAYKLQLLKRTPELQEEKKVKSGTIVTGSFAMIMAMPLLAEPVEGFRLNTGVYVDEGDLLVGIGYEFPVADNVSIVPGAEYVFVDRGDFYSFNVDTRIELNTSGRNPMWAGVGMGALHREIGNFEETDFGVNLLWGMDFDRNQNWMPYVSTKAVLSDESYFMVSFGLRFGGGAGASSASAN